MGLLASFQRVFASNGIQVQEHVHPRTTTLEDTAQLLSVPFEKFARAVLVGDGNTVVMVILPLNAVLDLDKLSAQTGTRFLPLTLPETNRRFPDCETGCHPPLPEIYGLKAWVDLRLFTMDRVYFEAGSRLLAISMTIADFALLCSRCKRADIANVLPDVKSPSQEVSVVVRFDEINLPSSNDVQQRLEQVYRLPAIPAVATQILQLVTDSDATAKDLAELVEMDPSIAAQVIRYARSSFFGYRGNVDSIQTAITRVLGFDIVSNLALGIAAGKVFKLTADGPLGLEQFWRHAVHNAALVQALTRHTNRALGIKPGTAYLAGLLHNFGVLLLGHLFQPEYYLLNKLCLANPELPITDIENKVFGKADAQLGMVLSHSYLGSWLMKHWKMPEEVIACTAHHHEASYSGVGAHYVALVYLANALLTRAHMGDNCHSEIPESVLQQLGLSQASVEAVLQNVLSGSDELNRMAAIMAKGVD